MTKYLIDNGANVNEKDNNGKILLHLGSKLTLKILINFNFRF